MDKKLATTVTTFGAAMAAFAIAPELQADIVDLTFSPATGAYGGLNYIDINEIAGSTEIVQWNDGVGKTLYAAGSIVGIAPVSVSQTLNASTFVGTGGIAFGPSSSGTVHIGFITAAGNVGWYSLDLGGALGDINYLSGQYGDEGESVHVGGDVPAPAGLAALALGAVGVRRNRKRHAA